MVLISPCPFYIFSHESRFEDYEKDKAKLETLQQEYGQIKNKLEELLNQGVISEYTRCKVNPYLDTIEKTFHQGYHWCVDQCEYATDVMFKSREALEDIYPSLVGHAFYDFNCTDVFSFPGRKLHHKFQGEAVSDYRKRPEGWRIKFKMKSNSIKMYDKFSCLRVEMTINDPKEFKVYKDIHHQDGTTSKR